MTLTKTVYTEEEVKKVLKSLLSEKKKSQELQEQLSKLQSSSEHTTLTDPTLLVTLNKKLSAAVTTSAQATEQVDKLKKLAVLQKKKLEMAEDEKAKLNEELQHAKSSLREPSAFQEQRAVLEKELQETQVLWRAAKGQLTKTQETLRTKEQETAVVERENQQLKAIQERLQEQVTMLQGELVQLQDTVSRQTQEVEKLVHDKAANASQLQALEEAFTTTQKKYEEAASLLGAAQEQQQNHKKQNEQLVAVLRDREQRIALLQEFEVGYKKLIGQKRDLESALHKESALLQQQYEAVKATQGLLQEARETIKTLEPYKEQSEALQQAQQALQADNGRFAEEVATLSARVAAACKEKEELQQQAALEFQWQAAALQKSEEVIAERRKALEDLSQDLTLTKQTLVRGMRELKALEERYLDAMNAKVATTLELQKTAAELQKKNADNELQHRLLGEATTALETLKTQNGYLQQSVEAGKAHAETLQARIQVLEEQGQHLANAKAATQQELEATRQTAGELQKQVASMKDEAVAAEHSRAELQRLHNDAKETIVSQQNTMSALKDRVRSLEGVIPALEVAERQRDELVERCNHLNAEIHDMSAHLQDTAESRDLVAQQLQEVGHMADEQQRRLSQQEEQLLSLEDKRKRLEEELHALQSAAENKDALLKEQLQQFKKKVQENAYLSEQLEAQKTQTNSVQNSLDNARGRIGDLETQLQERQAQETRLQGLLNESIKSAESQVSRWEEKYLHLYDRWQKCEISNNELKKFKQKYEQMAALLSDLGTHIATPTVPPTEDTLSHPIEPPTRAKPLGEQPATTSDLFAGLAPATHKVKNTLF